MCCVEASDENVQRWDDPFMGGVKQGQRNGPRGALDRSAGKSRRWTLHRSKVGEGNTRKKQPETAEYK